MESILNLNRLYKGIVIDNKDFYSNNELEIYIRELEIISFPEVPKILDKKDIEKRVEIEGIKEIKIKNTITCKGFINKNFPIKPEKGDAIMVFFLDKDLNKPCFINNYYYKNLNININNLKNYKIIYNNKNISIVEDTEKSELLLINNDTIVKIKGKEGIEINGDITINGSITLNGKQIS